MPSPPQCKDFKTFEEQADRLMNRGLIADKDELITRLRAVNYYRFTGYLYIFRETRIKENTGRKIKSETFRDGTSLELVWKYYLFDRRLRLLLIDAIERIEITLRTNIAHYWAKSAGISNPQKHIGHYKPKFQDREKLLENFQKSFDRSFDDCVLHHREDLGLADVTDLPIWVFCELSTFGDLVRLFVGLKDKLKEQISRNFGIDDVAFFTSMLIMIRQARNACAHHSRIWNRVWNYNPTYGIIAQRKYLTPIVRDTKLPDWSTQWDDTSSKWKNGVSRNHSFPKTSTSLLLTTCHFLLQTSANTSHWKHRLFYLLEHTDTPMQVKREMGFPEHWQEHPLWQ